MISRCDECRRFLQHPKDEPESVIEGATTATPYGEVIRTAVRRLVSIRLCDRCLQ